MSGTWADAGLRVVWTDFPIMSSDPIGDALRAYTVAYWKLDEASGTRVDSTNNYDLSDANNNVSGTTGKIENGAYFDATNQSLQNTDPIFQISLNESISFSFWFKFSVYPSAGTETYIVQHNDADNLFIEFINAFGDSYVNFYIYGSVDTHEEYYLPSLEQWAFFVGWYDGADHQAHVLINNSTDLFRTRSGTLSNPSAGVGAFMISTFFSNSASQVIIDELGIYSRVLTSDEIAYLYNSGNGRTLYP